MSQLTCSARLFLSMLWGETPFLLQGTSYESVLKVSEPARTYLIYRQVLDGRYPFDALWLGRKLAQWRNFEAIH